jgi:ABC-type antimicrobial peptide transport system permease subunit
MRFFDYFRLAFKNLSRQKIRTSLTIVAITIGSLSIILMASLLTTIRNSIYDFFEDMDAFTLVTVYPDPDMAENSNGLISSGGSPTEGKILNDQTVIDLKQIVHVADATPIGGNLWVKNMMLEGQTKKTWCNVIAYDPATNVFNMPLLAGRPLESADMDKIIVSTEFVKKYGDPQKPEDLIGKNVIFMFEGYYYPDWGDLVPEMPPEGDNKEWWDEQQKKTVEVPAEIIGIAKSSTFDSSQNYINIAWAKKLMTQQMWEWENTCSNEEMKYGYDCKSGQVLKKYDNFARNGYSSIILKADDMKNIKEVGDAVTKLGYGVTTAQDMLDEINKMLLATGTVLGIIGGISLFVAAIGIINTMVMATYERTREIGVMRACGATRGTIRRLFTFEAALLGLIGGIFGLILSYGIGKSANWIAVKYVTSVNLPFEKVASFPWWLIVGVLAFTTLVGLFSGLGPAIKAARLNPVDALRYE